MKKKIPYIHSNYERIPDDNYQTIDPRCVKALLDVAPIMEGQSIIDCCSNQGSAIVDELNNMRRIAHCVDDAFDTSINAHWNIFNPPYKKGLVDKIIWHQIKGLQDGRFQGLALLVKNNFDFAKSRWDMFHTSTYAGQIHMTFRPKWAESTKASPIHNYVWHIWTKAHYFIPGASVWWWREDETA